MTRHFPLSFSPFLLTVAVPPRSPAFPGSCSKGIFLKPVESLPLLLDACESVQMS